MELPNRRTGGRCSREARRSRDATTGPTNCTRYPRRLISDQEFDGLLPPYLQAVSRSFWTPAAVAYRAARLLAPDRSRRVLDIGSGVGKFCILGAAATRAMFVGVEHRPHLVSTAQATARFLEILTARFVLGGLDSIDILDFDAVYLFNPFEENLWSSSDGLDDTVELNESRFSKDVLHAQAMLARARPGTRVVTYHGFGGFMPASYRWIRREPCGTNYLQLWVKGFGSQMDVRSCAAEARHHVPATLRTSGGEAG